MNGTCRAEQRISAPHYNREMPFKRPPKTYDEESLYEYAVGALGRQMRTVAEIKRLMRRRVAPQPHGDLLVELAGGALSSNDTSTTPTMPRVTPAFAKRTKSSAASAWCRT